MSKSAFQVIAEIDKQLGSPGLVRTMQILVEQYRDLDDDVIDAYEEFRQELVEFAQQKVLA